MSRALGLGLGTVAVGAVGWGVLAGADAYGEAARVYPVTLAQAQAVLARAALPPLVFGDTPPQLQTVTGEQGRIIYILRKDGAEVMRYTATLQATEGGTEVALDLSGVENGRFGNVRARLEANPSVRNLYLTAMRERISADLEHRPYDMSAINMATVNAVFANMGSIRESMEAAAEASERQDRENIEKAYREEARRLGR